MWIFGYGSLIWRPDMDYLERRVARLDGWMRRFWQGSHDHRGLPHAPGRVVTLLPAVGEHCYGMAYRVDPGTAVSILDDLDYREKNGYARHDVVLRDRAGEELQALVYIATEHNFAWLGPASSDEMALQIASSAGPSGSNAEYLLELAGAFRELEIDDEHVFELEALVLRAQGGR